MGDYWMYLALLLLSLVAAPLLLFANTLLKRPKNRPPGPFPLPIIGNLHNMGKIPHKSLAELAKIHGPLMSLQLGSLNTVVVSSPSMAQQVLQKHDHLFYNRWVPDAVRTLSHHEFSIVFQPTNHTWPTIRKICNTQAFSNRSLDASQHLRQKNVEELLSNIRRCCKTGAAVDIGQAAFSSNLSLISNTFFSMDLADPDSALNHDLKELIWQMTYEAGKPNLGDYFPLIRGLDLQRIRRRMEVYHEKMISLLQTIIDERLANEGIDPSAESRDVLDAFLKASQDEAGKFEMSYIAHGLVDLYIGGTETASSTVEWAVAELLRDRNKMKKAQAELEQIIGRGNPIKEADIARLPYLQAIVKETLRLHPPAPFLVPRTTSSDVELSGFRVPKDSQVLINVWAIGRDPSVWERASCFEPERFLGSEIEFRGQHFELTPFGGGRRICPGLTLATRIIHLILGSLIHSFDWKLEDGVEAEKLDVDEKFGFAVQKAKPLLAIPTVIK